MTAPVPGDPRDQLAEAEGARRNGLASDGRGWFRSKEDRQECYAIADALLPTVERIATERAAEALRPVLDLADRLDEDWEAVMVGHDHDECLGDIIRAATETPR